ncbi:MAG: hypothetical protein ACOCT9_02210 [archaeon]
MITRGEKNMLFRSLLAVGDCYYLREKFENLSSEKKKFTQTKRNFMTIATHLTKVNAEVLKLAGSKEDMLKLKRNIEYEQKNRLNGFGINITLSDDEKCHHFFSRYSLIYIAIRDYLNYYEINKNKFGEKHSNILTRLRTCKTIMQKMFKKHAEDADLAWHAIEYALENKINKYEYEAKVKIV